MFAGIDGFDVLIRKRILENNEKNKKAEDNKKKRLLAADEKTNRGPIKIRQTTKKTQAQPVKPTRKPKNNTSTTSKVHQKTKKTQGQLLKSTRKPKNKRKTH